MVFHFGMDTVGAHGTDFNGHNGLQWASQPYTFDSMWVQPSNDSIWEQHEQPRNNSMWKKPSNNLLGDSNHHQNLGNSFDPVSSQQNFVLGNDNSHNQGNLGKDTNQYIPLTITSLGTLGASINSSKKTNDNENIDTENTVSSTRKNEVISEQKNIPKENNIKTENKGNKLYLILSLVFAVLSATLFILKSTIANFKAIKYSGWICLAISVILAAFAIFNYTLAPANNKRPTNTERPDATPAATPSNSKLPETINLTKK